MVVLNPEVHGIPLLLRSERQKRREAGLDVANALAVFMAQKQQESNSITANHQTSTSAKALVEFTVSHRHTVLLHK